MPYKGKHIQWNDVPDYDAWGVDDYWRCEHWMEWYNALENHFGRDTARKIWNYAYRQSTFGSAHLDCRSTNRAFMDFAEEKGLETNNSIFSDIIATGTTIGTDISKAIQNASGGIRNLSGTLKVVIPLAAITILSLYAYRIYKRS